MKPPLITIICFFKSSNINVKNFDFLYDFSNDLLHEKMSIKRAIQEQEEMINEIVGLWDSFKPTEESIIKKAKSKKQGGKIFAAWKSVLNNVDNLYKKRENRRNIHKQRNHTRGFRINTARITTAERIKLSRQKDVPH